MLNQNEKDIILTINDKEYMETITATPKEIEKAILIAKEEIKELESIVAKANNNDKHIEDLCKELKGHNETFSMKFPNKNYFDLNFKSLLITVEQPIDKNNNVLPMKVNKCAVSIYPDNISNVATDEIAILDFNENIDFKKIYEELENNKQNDLSVEEEMC